MKTSHWKWKGIPKMVVGLEKSKEEYGKANLLNNFCTDVEGGSRTFCVKCHAGYGWSENDKLPQEKSKIDCVSTAFYGSINHEVAPKEQSLKCKDCHMEGKRLDWKALGYKGDSMRVGSRFEDGVATFDEKTDKPIKKASAKK